MNLRLYFASIAFGALASFSPAYGIQDKPEEKGTIGITRPATQREIIGRIKPIMDSLSTIIQEFNYVKRVDNVVPQAPINHNWIATSGSSAAEVTLRVGLIPETTIYDMLLKDDSKETIHINIRIRLPGENNPSNLEGLLDNAILGINTAFSNGGHFFVQGRHKDKERMYTGYGNQYAGGDRSRPLRTKDIQEGGTAITQTYTSDDILIGEYKELSVEEASSARNLVRFVLKKFPINEDKKEESKQ